MFRITMKSAALAALLLAVVAPISALACGQIYGAGCPAWPVDPVEDARRTAANEQRLKGDLEACKRGEMFGSQCHGYCRNDDWNLGPRWCDQWSNFINRKPNRKVEVISSFADAKRARSSSSGKAP